MSKISVALFQHLLWLLCLIGATSATVNSTTAIPSDAVAILAFKAKADVRREVLRFSRNSTSRFCRWRGVQCYPGGDKVVRLVLRGLDLGGVFAGDTLSRLDQLRVLTLQNDSLSGPIPDLSALKNLKTLFLDHNSFSGAFPPSIILLHRIRTVDFSTNNLTGALPAGITSLDRLISLRLEHNRFTGEIPAMNQTSLTSFNVSGNNLTGAVPVTAALLRLDASSFSANPSLCGEIVHRQCAPGPPFFDTPTGSPSAAEVAGVELSPPGGSPHYRRSGTAMIALFSLAAAAVVIVICLAVVVRRRKKRMGKAKIGGEKEKKKKMMETSEAAEVEAVRKEQERELDEKVKRAAQLGMAARSGNLAFCAGEAPVYSLDQLMRASAELLGRGSVGTTYKAVLDNRLIVCVKRLDAAKLAGTTREAFESHMESVGGLRHPNLVPLRAYFQAKEERLLVYDYCPNGSLHSLIHGSKSSRAKPLHWTSCLKIAEDVAQGLSYIHQAWRLIHGGLKSRNVLLGPDFEACISDYCLSALLNHNDDEDEDHDNEDDDDAAYKAPETQQGPNRGATSKADVYAFGVLVLELVTGKAPSQLAIAGDHWARDVEEENAKMEMLVEVAVACSAASPEKRPTMWQVMKMLQEIKESVSTDDTAAADHHHDYTNS